MKRTVRLVAALLKLAAAAADVLLGSLLAAAAKHSEVVSCSGAAVDAAAAVPSAAAVQADMRVVACVVALKRHAGVEGSDAMVALLQADRRDLVNVRGVAWLR
jgi:hypothetical protein